jgi:metal-dependent amidase/aminoacylase/carboxypeptidase family protein
VGLFQAGEADNVVAGHAHLAGSVRTFSSEIRTRVQEEMLRTANLIAEVHNCTATLEIMRGAPSIVNDSALDAIVRSVAGDFLGAGNVHELPHPSTGAEDFGLFGSCGPIYMLRLGVRTPGKPIAHLHTPEFFADERAVGVGIKLMGRVVLRALTSRLS